MKMTLKIVCVPNVDCVTRTEITLLKDYEVVDKLQAKGIASSVSGVNFAGIKESPLPTSGNDKCSYYIANATDTTSFVLTIKRNERI